MEVDSRSSLDQKWSTQLVSLSNPKLIASAGFSQNSGEVSSISHANSSIEFQGAIGYNGTISDLCYHVQLNHQGDTISKNFTLTSNLGELAVVELENRGKRSIVMIIDAKMDNAE